ncbi:MAG: SDR family oxidoreductase [Pseudomonadota bacterium]
MNQNILITGASSGFGLLSTRKLISRGHRVIASMRDVGGRNAAVARDLEALGAHIVEIDVTDDASVESGVADAIARAGHIDVLVNNAGVGVQGIVEMFTVEDLQRIFDINVYGVHRMNRAILPHFHERGRGLLLQISSLLGRMTIPFYGPYNASKWALEGLTENYRTELANFGIDVALVEPGGFPTEFMERLIRPSDDSRNEAYGDFVHAPAAAAEGFEQALKANPQQDPQLVADAICHVIETPAGQRAFRTTVDRLTMGDAIDAYNEHLSKITSDIYQAFGSAPLLELKLPQAG